MPIPVAASERESERKAVLDEHAAKIERQKKEKEKFGIIKQDFFALFAMTNPQVRGKALEGVLNRLFAAYGILVREAFTVRSEDGRNIHEQIDGAIELTGQTYLVEMKWLKDPIGVDDVSRHLVRVFFRGQTRGIFISAAGYTAPALALSKESLQRAVIVLCDLYEVVRLLETDGNLMDLLKDKINAAMLDKNPFLRFAG